MNTTLKLVIPLTGATALGLLAAGCGSVGTAQAAKPAAPAVVACHSPHYKYKECYAPYSQPQLVRQVSSSPCIVNRSWGFNRKTQQIWVSAGCGGVFAESHGFHYGQANMYDPGTPYYHDYGGNAGTFGPTDGPDPSITNVWIEHQTIRETAAKRDTSQDADPTVEKFDKDGNPNYDYEGNYIGGHGLGTTVDNPDAPEETGNNPQPENGTTTTTDGDTTTTTTIETNKEGNAGRMEQTTTSSGTSSETSTGEDDGAGVETP